MENKVIISMSTKEIKRYYLMNQVIEKRVTQTNAAHLLGLSRRQVVRLVKRLKEKGPHGLIHKARGKPSTHRRTDAEVKRVLKLYTHCYHDFGPTLFSEHLKAREGIDISRETLRRWLLESNLWQRERRSRTHRSLRQRRHAFGEMLQLDGSHHDWLEGRGPKGVLVSFIDDATGHVFCRFYTFEGTLPAMDALYRYQLRRGLPASIYMDRHGAYKKDSQFQRALKELSIEPISAHSPQAKGRVERLFRTLQDRLVKEMRLEGISSLEEANEFLRSYLPRYNQRFERVPQSDRNLHHDIAPGVDVKHILSIQEKRLLRKDNTVRYQNKLYQIFDRWMLRRPKTVTIATRIDGCLSMTHQERPLHYRIVKEPKLKCQLAA